MNKSSGTQSTPWTFFLIRLLFKFVLKVFYGTIVVENEEYIPKDGQPCILCCNHGNSLTDPLMLVRSIPSKTRKILRLTAKDTLFGKPTFSSWLIEASGALPMKRQKDHVGEKVDNKDVMEVLMKALESGDMICLFPEGISRYHPKIAPLKTGVARIVSDVLSRHRDEPDFEVTILTCSLTYMHREHFRSDVLLTFNPPINLKVKDHPTLLSPPSEKTIRSLTSTLQAQISLSTIDAPSWDVVQVAKTATRLYAPLGTQMGLGDYVRVLRGFVDGFTLRGGENGDRSGDDGSLSNESEIEGAEEIMDLARDLQRYQTKLNSLGVKDDRIRKPLARISVIQRLIVRTSWLVFLTFISLPGLLLWSPVFLTTSIGVSRVKSAPGKPMDTWDEIAQAKLVYGLGAGLAVWIGGTLLLFPLAPLLIWVIPSVMWLSLRWLEDAVSAFRAMRALWRLLRVGKPVLRQTLRERGELHKRVMDLAINRLGLPAIPEVYFTHTERRGKGQVRGAWDSGARYFSLRRRRKRDWNEVLRLYDKVDYPEQD